MRKLFKTILPALIIGLFIGGVSLGATILFPSGGGTGIGTYSRGDILIATTTSQFYKLATGTEGYVLTISSGMPAWVASAGGGIGIDTWNISGATMTATDTVSQITVSLASTTLATTTISTLNLTTLNYASTTNWDSAYGWGDHSLAGYLTSYTESDPKWVASSTDYYNKTQIDASNTAWLVDTDTTYSASGTLLNLTGTNFSVNAGTLTDTKGCIYTAGTGLVCNSTFLTSYSETDPVWQASSTNYYTSVQIDAKGYLTTVDISANTNLAVTHPIVLTNDTLSLSTASSSLWQTAYTHSQLTSENPHSVTKSDVGLANVENTTLSSWGGSQNILTVGVIATGTWQGTPITDNYVADNITLTDITQITNRAISDLTGTLAIASTTGTLGIDRGGTNKDMTGWSGLLNITNGVVATTSETDPKVGTLTNTKWCSTNGTVINCTENAPAGGGVSSLNSLAGDLTLWGTSPLTVSASGTVGLILAYTESDPIWQASSTSYIPYTGATTEVVLGQDLTLGDDQYLYFDTAKSKYLRYSSDHGGLVWGDGALPFIADIYIAGNTGADGSGTWEPYIEITTDGRVVFANTTQGANKRFEVTFTDGMRLQTTDSHTTIKADNVTTAQTVQFPDASGTFALTSDLAGFTVSNFATDTISQWVNDSGYLTSFSETDPKWTASSTSYLTITTAASTYLATGTAASTYLTIANAASTYLATGTAASTYVARNTWTTIDNYPSDCVGGGMVYGLADTLSCYSTTTIRTNLALVVGTNVQAYDANNATTGSTVAKATALASDPSDCGAGTKAISIDASGNLTCSAVSLTADVSGILPYTAGGTGTSTALASQYLWWGDGAGNLVQVASSTFAGAAAGVSSLNTLTGALTLWGTSPLTISASGTVGLIIAVPNVATTGVATLSSLTSIGTIATGTWQGTKIANTYGGTGQDSSGWTGIPKITTGTWATSTILSNTISISFLNATTTKNVEFSKQFAMTLTKVWGYCDNGSSTFNIVDRGGARANATTTLSASLVISSVGAIASSTSFSFSTIAANDILNASTTAVTGTPDCYINIDYTRTGY